MLYEELCIFSRRKLTLLTLFGTLFVLTAKLVFFPFRASSVRHAASLRMRQASTNSFRTYAEALTALG